MGRSVVIVDDHADFRAQAADLLVTLGWTVLASCVDGRSALDIIDRLHPDVVLLDVHLPDLDGFAVLDQLAQHAVHPIVVLISTREATDFGRRLARSGAAGFISKAELSGPSLARLLGDAA